MDYVILIIASVAAVFALLSFITSRNANSGIGHIISRRDDNDMTDKMRTAVDDMSRTLSRVEVEQQEMSRVQASQLNELTNRLITDKVDGITRALNNDKEANKEILASNTALLKNGLEIVNRTTETRLDTLTKSLTEGFDKMRAENNAQIDKIRETMTDKLDKTLNEQFEKSFKGVISQMSDLQKTMGELKGISNQVGSLEKTLNGVKTRGIAGEVQLKQIIADILTPNQYEVEFNTRRDTNDHVEIAIKLPDKNSDKITYLPIDSKCHLDRYEQLLAAYDAGDKDQIKICRKLFADVIRDDANKIKNKYVNVPFTTPYAILFVPFEGMYSEIVNLNLIEELNKIHITVAGPYTLTAILSTVTNYFQSLAIERKAYDIEQTLGTFKSQFSKFNDSFDKVRKNLETATTNLDHLKTTRINAINRALRGITEIESSTGEEESDYLLD